LYSLTPSETVKVDRALRATLGPINVIDHCEAALDRLGAQMDGLTTQQEVMELSRLHSRVLAGLRIALTDLTQGHMALVAAMSAVRKEAVLDGCGFSVDSKEEKHQLRRADWRAPVLFDNALTGTCEALYEASKHASASATASLLASPRTPKPPGIWGAPARGTPLVPRVGNPPSRRTPRAARPRHRSARSQRPMAGAGPPAR
jgi:hypothetical protein